MSAPDTLPDSRPGRRVAVVTGSDSGIGRAVAVALARQGCDVGVTWHEDADGAERTAEEVRATGRRAEVRHLDLERLPDAARVVDELADALGNRGGGGDSAAALDVLVNCAGTGTATPFSAPPTPGTSRAPRGRWTAGCCRWARWRAPT